MPQTPTGKKRQLSPNANTPVGRLGKMSTETGASPVLSDWRLEEYEFWQDDNLEKVFTDNSKPQALQGINKLADKADSKEDVGAQGSSNRVIERDLQTPRRRLGSHGIFSWMMNNNRVPTPRGRTCTGHSRKYLNSSCHCYAHFE